MKSMEFYSHALTEKKKAINEQAKHIFNKKFKSAPWNSPSNYFPSNNVGEFTFSYKKA